MAEMMFSSTLSLLESEPGSSQSGLSPELCLKSLGRPLDPRLELEQLPSTLFTAQARAEVAAQFGGPTLLLGDDDLVSLSIAGPCHVLELDKRIVDFLGTRRVSIALHDLMQGIPSAEKGAYLTVIADPPYASKGFAAFMQCAHDALQLGGHFVLSTNLAHLEAPVHLESWGFKILSQKKAFNRYPYPPELRQACIEKASLYDFPPDLAEQIFGPPLFYADLFVLQKVEE